MQISFAVVFATDPIARDEPSRTARTEEKECREWLCKEATPATAEVKETELSSNRRASITTDVTGTEQQRLYNLYRR